jgi:predicted PhzF superfamily epimerase YddE/YHI9
MGRKNEISVEVTKDRNGKIEEVTLSGRAVEVMEGRLEL